MQKPNLRRQPRRGPLYRQPTPPDHQRDRRRADQLHRRVVPAHRRRSRPSRPAIWSRCSPAQKSLIRPLLAVEELHNRSCPLTCSCMYAVDPRHVRRPLPPIALANMSCGRSSSEYRIAGITASVSSASSQLIRSMISHDERQHEDVLEDRQHARGKHLVQRVHVARSRASPAARQDCGQRTPHGDIRCRCRKIWLRRSNMIFCPVHCIMYVCTNSNPKISSREAKYSAASSSIPSPGSDSNAAPASSASP